MKQDLSCL